MLPRGPGAGGRLLRGVEPVKHLPEGPAGSAKNIRRSASSTPSAAASQKPGSESEAPREEARPRGGQVYRPPGPRSKFAYDARVALRLPTGAAQALPDQCTPELLGLTRVFLNRAIIFPTHTLHAPRGPFGVPPCAVPTVLGRRGEVRGCGSREAFGTSPHTGMPLSSSRTSRKDSGFDSPSVVEPSSAFIHDRGPRDGSFLSSSWVGEQSVLVLLHSHDSRCMMQVTLTASARKTESTLHLTSAQNLILQGGC